jgi:spermidine/putrescine transport system substrate-binding protein
MSGERPEQIIPDRLTYERMLLTRRALLRNGGLAALGVGALPALLAACGGGSDEGGGEAAGGGATTTATAGVPKASGTIDFLSWEGYDIPGPMKAWKQENGVDVKATYIGNHDDIQAKILAGGGTTGYDLITYYQGYKKLYAELGILKPIDVSKLPNLKGEFPYFASDVGNFWIDPDGSHTGVPWTWGSIGITYDSAKVSGLASWFDLLDPKFKGKIAVVDDPTGALTLTARVFGYDPATITQDQKAKIVDFLKQMVAQSKGISPSFGDMTTKLVSGDAVACYQGWSAMNSFAADAGLSTVRTDVPKEGSFSYCDVYAIPTTTDNEDTATAWINESIDPVVNAKAAEFLVGGVTVEAAVEHLDEKTAALYPYDKLDELLDRAPFYDLPPTESDEYVTFKEWIDTWQEIKAGA